MGNVGNGSDESPDDELRELVYRSILGVDAHFVLLLAAGR